MALRTLPNAGVEAAGRSRAEALVAGDGARLRRYQEYLDFYNGKQWVRERRGRSNLTLNYARTVVDKGVSYLFGRGVNFAVRAGEDLEGIGSRVNGKGTKGTGEAEGAPDGAGIGRGRQEQGGGRRSEERSEAAERLIYRVYEDSELEAADAQAATNGSVLGDSVFKVYRDPERCLPRVVNVDPMRFFCSWAEDDLARMRGAHQLYHLSAEEAARRFGGPFRGGRVAVVERWTETELSVWAGDRQVVHEANPYGFIPFVHVPNARPANEFWGTSDLRDIVPIGRELNERFSDIADVIRFHSDPPVVFKGVSEHTEMAVGPGTVWDIPEGAEVSLLEWRGQQPAVFEHIDRVMRALHDVAETPKTAFGESGRIQSGVALEVELQSLIQKTMRKRAWWTGALRRRNAMVLRVGELMGLGSFAPYASRVVWPALLPTDTEAEVRNNVALVSAGLRSRRTAMDRLGEESPEDEMKRMREEGRDASRRLTTEAKSTAGKKIGS